MVDRQHKGHDTVIEQVKLTDLENVAYLPKGRCIKGMLAGNDNWRSPEAHFKGELNKPTDMFSFGLVVSATDFEQTGSADLHSVYTLYSDVSYADQTKTSRSMNRKAHFRP